MNFYQQTGKMALGSRLRRLSDWITEDAAQLFATYGVELEPKWFPVFYVLSRQENVAVTEISEIIGQTHASVSQIAKEMTKAKLIVSKKDKTDGRRALLRLSEKGKSLIPRIELQYEDVNNAIEALLSEMQHDLWRAIEEMEYLLGQQRLPKRVRHFRKQREMQKVNIVDYEPAHHEAFRSLNHAWITKYFKLEESDNKSLDHPEETILKPGGHIFMAKYEEDLVGTCALLKMNDEAYDYELVKMAVAESAQGKNIGWLLGKACIDKARAMGARKLYLESNTRLEAAINLYHKLGFQRVVGKPSPYERCNIQMELEL